MRPPAARPEPPTPARVALAVLLAVLAVLLGIARPAGAQAAERCFPETGYCISGPIRSYWERNGGLPVFGFPIGPQQEELVEGRPLQGQWFERNRLEIHPENQPPYDVLLGRLGADRLERQGRDWRAFPQGPPVRDVPCRAFPETGHAVCGDFLAYFRAHGLSFDGRAGVSEQESIALFGLPISDEVQETLGDGRVYTVQWFERARVERHPENPAPYGVLLGLLGGETRGPSGCDRGVIPTLARAYERTYMKLALGCPQLGAAWVSAARQSFEGGEMIWVNSLYHKDGRIFVLLNGQPQTYRLFADTTWAGMPDMSGYAAPPGRVVPAHGFGKVWHENPDVRARLGWAYSPETPDTVDAQIFERGAILWLQSFRIGGPLSNVPAAIVFGPADADIQYIGVQ